MTTYVLVPGFFFGPWVWERTGQRLTEAGHDVRAVALSGQGQGEPAGAEVGIETHTAEITGAIGDLDDVVLVLHSGATIAGTTVADRIPGQLRHIVYVDTAPFPDGMAQIEFLPPERQAAQRELVERADGLPYDENDYDEQLMAGLTDGHREQMRQRASAQPAGLVLQPVRRPAVVPDTPRTLISTSYPVEQVRAMVGVVPAFSTLAGPGWSMTDLPTGHWPMLSRPDDLAELLISVVERP